MTGPAPVTASSAVDGAGGSDTLIAVLRRVRRHWALVLVFVVVAVAGAVAAKVVTPTTYVGRTSLIVSSNNRAPEQDAVLVQGYITYFNDAAYQRQLLAAVRVRGDVELSAQAAASSPIVVISATTRDEADAQTYAIEVARAFRDDINRVDSQSKAAQLAALQQQLDAAQATNTPNSAAVVSDLHDRIASIRADEVNELQELQAQGGVAIQGPSLRNNLLYAAPGGLLLGIVAALLMGRWSRRLPGALEVADKVGLRTLVEMPRRRGRAGRALSAQRLAQLASIMRAQLGSPGVVAIAQPDGGTAARFVAGSLARAWAAQGYPTVLVRLDGSPEEAGHEAAGVLDSAGSGLSLLELSPLTDAGAPAVPVSRLGEVLQQETLVGQYVVVEAPAVIRSGASQAVCQVADRTVLVIDTQRTRAPGAREAVGVLRDIGARLAGAIVAAVPRGRAAAVDLPVADGAPAGEVRAGDAVRVGAHDRGAADITAAGPADGRPTDQVRPDHGEAEPLPPDPEPGDPGSAARTVAPVAELSSRLPAVLVVPGARSRDTRPDGE